MGHPRRVMRFHVEGDRRATGGSPGGEGGVAGATPSRIRSNRRPPHPQQPIFAVFRRGGLHFGRHFPYESHSCRRCVDSMLLMPPPPPNRPGSGYHRARECSSSAQWRPGSKLMPRGHSANNERSARPRVGLTSSDTTRQHHVSNSPFSMPTRGRSAGNRSLIFLEMPPPTHVGLFVLGGRGRHEPRNIVCSTSH